MERSISPSRLSGQAQDLLVGTPVLKGLAISDGLTRWEDSPWQQAKYFLPIGIATMLQAGATPILVAKFGA
jgi:hypothetical protein